MLHSQFLLIEAPPPPSPFFGGGGGGVGRMIVYLCVSSTCLCFTDHNLTKLGAVIYKAKKGEATVSLSLNDSSTVTTNLRHALDDHDLEHHTMVEYTKQGISICARLPKPGYYTLKLFAKDKSAEGPLPHAGDFLLYSDTAQHECRPFPTVYGLAKDLRARLLEPRYGQVPAGQPTLYRVQVSGVLKMTTGGQKAELKNDGVWEATVTPGGDVTHLTVFAGLDDSKSLKGLYQFTVVQWLHCQQCCRVGRSEPAQSSFLSTFHCGHASTRLSSTGHVSLSLCSTIDIFHKVYAPLL